ncbi:hypothetical protein BDQ12DRAFT_716390 [Crucibulum laeve]|uniref:HNH nuclease domain-containing protein n=1 Tax=Crucibulum laeve TaxID=68775 RepID=A0A5C3LKN8_9AGAR|nr:hypothetical protein BDQ12DRAFT_716390 [Crucibulum laeve]
MFTKKSNSSGMAEERTRSYFPDYPLLPETHAQLEQMTANDAMNCAKNTLDAFKWTFLPSVLKYAPSPQGQLNVSMLILHIRAQFDWDYIKDMKKYMSTVKANDPGDYRNTEKFYANQYQSQIIIKLMELDLYYKQSLILPQFGLKNCVQPLTFSFLPLNYYSGYPVKSCSRSDNRELLLKRDYYMCRATGRYDLELGKMASNGVVGDGKYWKEIDNHVYDHTVSADYLQAAHIIPYSLNNFDEKTPEEVYKYQVIWKTLQAFSGFDLSTLKGTEINKPSNMVMLCPTAHKMHDDLRLSFSPVTGQPTRFKVNTFGETNGWFGLVKDDTTTLNIKNELLIMDSGIDPTYLAIHHAICVILEESGIYPELKKDRLEEYIKLDEKYILGD